MRSVAINWEAIGAVGEIGGAIGVVVTLIYLAGQLRQNTQALRSSTNQAYNERTDSYWDFQAEHSATLGSIYESQKPYAELTSQQRLIVDSLMMKAFNLLEAMFLHHQSGAMGDNEFRAKKEGFRRGFQNAMGQESWRRLGPTMAFTDEFRQFMDAEIIGPGEITSGAYFDTFQ